MAMGFGQMLLFLFLLHFAHITTAQQPDFLQYFCTNSANYTTNSTYQSNLQTVLTSLPSNTSNNYGFYNTPVGQDPDRVYPAALCRGDVSRDICRECVYNATLKLIELCPNQKEAIGWYDLCMLRYSNDRVFHSKDPQFYTFFMWSLTNVTSVAAFNQALRNLTERLQVEAATGGPVRKFATGSIGGPDRLTISGLMQCTPDLSEMECITCLNGTRSLLPQCCNGRQGGRVIRPNCNLRYEIGMFYDTTPAITLPQHAPTPTPAPFVVSPPPLSNIFQPPTVVVASTTSVVAAMTSIVVPLASTIMIWAFMT